MSVISEEDATIDDTKAEQKPLERSASTPALASVVPKTTVGSIEYDEPFIDPHHRQSDTATADPVQSSYFTLSSEHQKLSEDMSRHSSQLLLQQKKTKRRRKRMSADQNAATVLGYLCNEYLVRDILHLLKDAISDLSAAKFTLSGKTSDVGRKSGKSSQPSLDPVLESALQTHILTSIEQEAMPKRITKFTQVVHEAWWRFQLVAHDAFPRQPARVLTEKVIVMDNDIHFLPACEGTVFTPDADYPNSSVSRPSISRGLSNSHTVVPQANIITQMMATPENLLVQSLIKNSTSQAAEVIKLFHLTDKTAEMCEVSFADIYQTSTEKIWDLETEGREAAPVPQKVGKRSVKALSKAAALGVATATLSNIVEDLLAKTCVPPAPRPKTAFARENFSHLFNIDSSSALLLDLLCTSCKTWESCCNMLDIIKTKTKLLDRDLRHMEHLSLPINIPSDSLMSPPQTDTQSLASSSSSITSVTSPAPGSAVPRNLKSAMQGIVGCSEFLWTLYDLIHIGDEDSSPYGSHARHAAPSAKMGLQHHFHSACCPLNKDSLRRLEATVMELRRAVDRVQQILSGSGQGHQLDISVEDPMPSPTPSPRGSLSGSLSGSMTGSTHSANRTLVKQPTDQNPLHIAVKHLMFTMEKLVPGEGLTHMLLGKSGKVTGPPVKNYLLSLYEHVKEMAYLVAECESKSREVASNYFSMLDDGPVNVLGRLMFVKKMPPARLEAVAEKLSLNLTHTIVYSCCPKIPSKHPPPVPESGTNISPVTVWGTKVYNTQRVEISDTLAGSSKEANQADQEDPQGSFHHPEVAVRAILIGIVKLMEDVASQQSAKDVFDLTCAKSLVQMSEFADVLEGTRRLVDVDMTLLQTDEDRLCFFANLTNLMLMHCHLSRIQQRLEISKRDGAQVTNEVEQLELYPLCAADNMAYFSSFSYTVGQLGIVSVFDLLTILCRDGLHPSLQWTQLLSCRKLVLSPEDPWKQFCPAREPRLVFVLNTGCVSSPPLQVLEPGTVESQLEQAMKSYLSHTVVISVEHEKVSLPQLLMWHEKDFTGDSESHRETSSGALIKWVLQHVNEEKQKQLQQLFSLDSVHGYSENIDTNGRNELPFRIETDSFDNTFSVVFDMANVKVSPVGGQTSTKSVQQPRSSGYRLTCSFERSGQGWSLELPTYNLTPVTLEYVKQDSLLVATMVSLVCADSLDNIEQQFTDDHFTLPESAPRSASYTEMYLDPHLPPCRSTSDISLVDIRSYRYHRLTDDYPILQRHLLHYILPLAAVDNPELMESREPILKFVTNDIDDQVKLCMFSLAGSEQFQCVVQDMANRLLEEHKWLEMLHILHSLPQLVMEQQQHLQALHDFVLSCWALTQVQKPGYAPKVGDGLRKFYNPALQARTVLSIYKSLPLDLSIDLLDLCLTSLDKDSGLWKAVSLKHRKTKLYGKIMDSVKTLRIKLSMKDLPIFSMESEDQKLHGIVENFTDWCQIPRATKKEPEDVMLVLEATGDFATAKEWAQLHHLSDDAHRTIKERHLYYLLTCEQPDTVTAFQELDGLRVSSEPECLAVCHSLADRLTYPREIKFVVSFMLQYLEKHLEPEELEELRLKRIGAKALMCVPANILADYIHLISCPHLILEQLLMNMKAELAGQIFDQIKQDFLAVREPRLRVAQDQFNSLVARYASRAIEVKVVQVLVDRSRSDSLTSSNSDHEEGDLTFSTSRKYGRREGGSGSPTPGSSLSPSRQGTPTRLDRQGGSRPHRQSGRGFIMPVNPPTQDQWVPDDATAVCMVCTVERFSMFNRRHHCRRCGRVVCAACSSKQTMVFGVMSRTCTDCYEQTGGANGQEDEIYSQRMRERLSGAMSGSSIGSAPPPPLPSHLSHAQMRESIVSTIHHVNHLWKLHPDSSQSEEIRSEFYYEQAPSVSLCLSILKQHSKRAESGKVILSICDTLSSHLVPISPGVPNPEIDYSLIISIMKQLLFQAKLDFLHSGSSGMTDQCDMYLGRVDLLRVMVGANFKDLPTIRELTKHDSVRRLRDKLIADERLSLAMEVSTKCGIDPSGVWSAMGFACLHLGDYVGARDKFSHCLKVPTDKNQHSANQSRLLGEILDFLDTIPSSGLTEVQRLLSNPESICNIKTLLVPSVGEENRIESVPYKECLYYLRMYGSFMDHISFLRQHSYWMKAVQFAVDHHCSADVFVHGLMVPAMSSGEIGRLLEQMLMLDPTLDKWTSYLTATCKHLLKQKYFYSLYQIQLFMKDYIRAAMTCISHFYQKGATSYVDLSGRLQYLFTAQQHLQAYLDPSQWGSVRHPLAPHNPSPTPSPTTRQGPSWDKQSPESAPRMTLTPEQVKKHITTIALQIEVTKFLKMCLNQPPDGASPITPRLGASPGSQLPTLFGQGAARTELVGMILLSGNDFTAAFDLAVRIVKECRLNPTLIFTHCSRELAKQGRFAEITTLTQSLIREGLVNDEGIDEIVGASLLVIADSHSQARDESDSLIQLLRNDSNKINAYILCGKLRSAYLLAVKGNRIEDVQRIAGAAQRLEQSAVKNICKKWLEQHKK